mmetsp:Transcript_8056/g.23599  ORF Transcript_8056/g.23599 Transcript_8056/m.23599 type:complete len:231 (-) Transcript_8056:1639-2331(-)
MSCACMMTRISSRICWPALPPRPMVASVQRIQRRHRGWPFQSSAMRTVIWFVVPASIRGCVHVFFSHVRSRWNEKRCHTKIQLQKPSLLALMLSSSGISMRGIDGFRDQTAADESTCTKVLHDRSFRMCTPSLCFSHMLTKSRQFSYRLFSDIWFQVTSCSTILSATLAHSPLQRPAWENRTVAFPPLAGLSHSLPSTLFSTKLIPAIAGSTASSESPPFFVAGIEKSRP